MRVVRSRLSRRQLTPSRQDYHRHAQHPRRDQRQDCAKVSWPARGLLGALANARRLDSVMAISTFCTGFIVALIVQWRLALVMSTIGELCSSTPLLPCRADPLLLSHLYPVPCIFGVGHLMDKYLGRNIIAMLGHTAEGATLVEEVVSSIRTTHAFGTQKKLAQLYDVPNEKA